MEVKAAGKDVEQMEADLAEVAMVAEAARDGNGGEVSGEGGGQGFEREHTPHQSSTPVHSPP